MPDAAGVVTEAAFIEAPRDSRMTALFAYWDGLRRGRAMPARADIDPVAIREFLPYVFMYSVARDRDYTIRLVGDEVVNFIGRNATGSPAGTIMPPRSAAMIVAIIDAVTGERAPKFRAGKAHWLAEKTDRDYEACFLPLSADGDSVDIVFGGVVFPDTK
ncbi:MAG: PAS domain-containing protein [Stellaceae bacterium]